MAVGNKEKWEGLGGEENEMFAVNERERVGVKNVRIKNVGD